MSPVRADSAAQKITLAARDYSDAAEQLGKWREAYLNTPNAGTKAAYQLALQAAITAAATFERLVKETLDAEAAK